MNDPDLDTVLLAQTLSGGGQRSILSLPAIITLLVGAAIGIFAAVTWLAPLVGLAAITLVQP